MKSPNNWRAIYITHEDVWSYSPWIQPGWLCAGLGWAEWWHPRVLVETEWSPHTHALRYSLSLLCFSLLSIPPSTRLPSSNWVMRKSSTRGKSCQLQWQKKAFSKAGIKEKGKSEQQTLTQQDKRNSQKSLSLRPVKIFRLCFLPLILFSFAVVLEN